MGAWVLGMSNLILEMTLHESSVMVVITEQWSDTGAEHGKRYRRTLFGGVDASF